VAETNLLEEYLRDIPSQPNGCELAIGKHKVITLRLNLAPA